MGAMNPISAMYSTVHHHHLHYHLRHHQLLVPMPKSKMLRQLHSKALGDLPGGSRVDRLLASVDTFPRAF